MYYKISTLPVCILNSSLKSTVKFRQFILYFYGKFIYIIKLSQLAANNKYYFHNEKRKEVEK